MGLAGILLAVVLGTGATSATTAPVVLGAAYDRAYAIAGAATGGEKPLPLSSGGCLRVRIAIAPDSVPDAVDFEPAACAAYRAAPAYRYDSAAHITRAARVLMPGELVGAYPEFGADIVRPGQILKLIAQSGAVRIVREVQAIQLARPGERLFVKSSDGQVFSARYEAASP
jgi:hypothetical protein